MKDKRTNIKTIIIILLVGIIISMFFIILNIKNKNIESQEMIEEQLGETSTDNAYVSIEAHLSELSEKQKELDNMQNTAGKATVTADKILKDYTAYKNGQLITGTMANNGAVTQTLNAGGSYTIPAGYHNGNGKITANSLASQTSATATASDILSGKTAWVNGTCITGNMQSTGQIVATGAYQSGSSTSSASRKVTINNGTYTIYISCWTTGSSTGNTKPTITLNCNNSLLYQYTAIVEQDAGHKKFSHFSAYKITVTNGNFTINASHTPAWNNSVVQTAYMISS